MSKHTALEPGWPWIEKFGFAAGILSGNTIHTCGLVAFDPDGRVVGDGDIVEQTRQVFENIKTVLTLGGATMDDVVKITTYLPDMSLYKGFSQVRAEAFPNGIPASTAVSAALVLPELLVEIEAVAVI